jgi:hypothetical protein
MIILDLCAGTGSVQRAVPRAKVVSVDIDPKNKPTIVADVLSWDYAKAFPIGYFDIIWASPPCTHYSMAKTKGIRDYAKYDAIVKRCFEIIMYYRSNYWFVENPGGGAHLHKRPFMKTRWNKYLHECCYCRYGYPYKKTTHIWTNRKINLKMCTIKTPCKYVRRYGKHPFVAQSGPNFKSRTGPGTRSLSDRYSVPTRLIKMLFSEYNVHNQRMHTDV